MSSTPPPGPPVPPEDGDLPGSGRHNSQGLTPEEKSGTETTIDFGELLLKANASLPNSDDSTSPSVTSGKGSADADDATAKMGTGKDAALADESPTTLELELIVEQTGMLPEDANGFILKTQNNSKLLALLDEEGTLTFGSAGKNDVVIPSDIMPEVMPSSATIVPRRSNYGEIEFVMTFASNVKLYTVGTGTVSMCGGKTLTLEDGQEFRSLRNSQATIVVSLKKATAANRRIVEKLTADKAKEASKPIRDEMVKQEQVLLGVTNNIADLHAKVKDIEDAINNANTVKEAEKIAESFNSKLSLKRSSTGEHGPRDDKRAATGQGHLPEANGIGFLDYGSGNYLPLAEGTPQGTKTSHVIALASTSTGMGRGRGQPQRHGHGNGRGQPGGGGLKHNVDPSLPEARSMDALALRHKTGIVNFYNGPTGHGYITVDGTRSGSKQGLYFKAQAIQNMPEDSNIMGKRGIILEAAADPKKSDGKCDVTRFALLA